MSNDTILDLALRVSRSYDDMTRDDLTPLDQELYDLAHALLDIHYRLNYPSQSGLTAVQLARAVFTRNREDNA